MNKNAIKKFAIDARNKLIASVTDKAGMLGITPDNCSEAITKGADFEVYKTAAGTEVTLNKKQCEQRRKLVDQIHARGFEAVVEEVAYTWFNRICAIRFMEVNDYMYPVRVRVLSSEKEGKNEPDVVTMAPEIDWDFTDKEREEIIDAKMNNRLDDLFRMLFIKQCNLLHEVLPGLFEETEDYTEMLLNISFTNEADVIRMLVDGIDEKDFNITTVDEDGKAAGQVEIIGWLYQYYNTEPKNKAFAKKAKITKEEIPAVTQLFTPDWIVRYMVENSLGRMWLEGHPDEELKSKWKYYLDEAEQEESVQHELNKIKAEYATLKPEDIKLIDPCMGSGHILVYAFDVFMQIYENAGWSQRDAAQSIIQNNIYGLDIDDRAAQLSYFAVLMKARQYDRRILTRGIEPNVYAVQESNGINRGQLKYFGVGLVEEEKNASLMQIEGLLNILNDAKEYGSLLNVEDYDWELLEKFVENTDTESQISFETYGLDETAEQLKRLIRIGKVMAQKYEIVATNPPYAGTSNLSAKVNNFVKKNYPDSKADLFAVFIERCGEMLKKNGYQAMITQHAWMFLSSFEKLRVKLQQQTIVNMAHLGARAFEEIGGEVVQTVSFVMLKRGENRYKGVYCRLLEPTTQKGKEEMFLKGENQYEAIQDHFGKIPGGPVAYWISDTIRSIFEKFKRLDEIATPKRGMCTCGNELFYRFWHEISYIEFCDPLFCRDHDGWVPLNKGGEYRKWYGNLWEVVDWKNNAERLRQYPTAQIKNEEFYFRPAITWSSLTTGNLSFRYTGDGFIFDQASNGVFPEGDKYYYYIAFLNSKITVLLLNIINPSMNVLVGDIASLPIIFDNDYKETIDMLVESSIEICKIDWNSYEISWDFCKHPLMPQREEEGITIFAGMKIGEEKWIKKLYDGEVCFSPVGDFIVEGETTGNNEQGDKYEGVFARLKKDNPLIRKMNETLGDDLEKILDGDYVLLRRKSCKEVPVLCLYGMYKEDAEEIERKMLKDGTVQSTLQFQLSNKMYDEFLNADLTNDEKIEPWSMGMSLGHFQIAIEKELDKRGIQHKAVKINYDLSDTEEFFIEPTNNYDELAHKSDRLNYQKEIRWILPNMHQMDKLVLPYTPLSKESVGIAKGKIVFKVDVAGHVKESVSVASCFNRWQKNCNEQFEKLKQNEEELNRIFINIYGLQEELTPEVEDKDITVRKADLSRDIRSLVSYAVGCMLGRYSLDEEGLVYAGGDWDNSRYKIFLPDEDNCIPITDEEYFSDDIVGRFVEFVKIVYGADTLEENLDFIANALGNKGNTSREVIRNYFLKDFYADHLKVYQKRPIYWLFDSGKQNGFKALIYMHRYDADTVGRVRTDYLHKAQKYVETAMQSAQYTIDNATSASEKSKATKAVTKYTKQLSEMKIYDEAIAHVANQRIEIDLDDGVKVNYAKFQGVEVSQEGKKSLKVDLMAKI